MRYLLLIVIVGACSTDHERPNTCGDLPCHPGATCSNWENDYGTTETYDNGPDCYIDAGVTDATLR
jgi:hypothetical protein